MTSRCKSSYIINLTHGNNSALKTIQNVFKNAKPKGFQETSPSRIICVKPGATKLFKIDSICSFVKM